MIILPGSRSSYQVKIAVLGDQHIDSDSSPATVTATLAAVANSDVDIVIHMGDAITLYQNNPWSDLDAAWSALDGKKTWLNCVGNHDYEVGRELVGLTSVMPKSSQPWMTAWADGSIQSWCYATTIRGIALLFIGLPFGPTQSMVEWADGMVKAYPSRTTVVCTHAHLYSDGLPYNFATDTGDKKTWNPHSTWGDDCLDGSEMWSKAISGNASGFLRGNTNIRLLLCGHTPDGVARRVDTRAGGTRLRSILTDYQALPNQGWYRTLELDFVGDRIRVVTMRSTDPAGAIWSSDKAPAEDFSTSNFVITNAGLT